MKYMMFFHSYNNIVAVRLLQLQPMDSNKPKGKFLANVVA